MDGMYERDRLTGVYTRSTFLELAQQLIESSPGKQFDIVLSDFVGFKYFNQRFGTEAGDLLLKKTGEMICTMAPKVICGRYSGDRFVTIVDRLPEQGIGYLDHFQLPGEAKEILPVSSIVVKFGVCHVTDTDPVNVCCDRAVLAVESVKHRYGRNVAVYDDSVGAAALNEFLIEENMEEALASGQFEVYYQPKFSVEDRTVCGAEALVRWKHPVMGFMNPGIFIPLFEKNGFITELDIYVWDRVCRDISGWRGEGRKPVPVSVNVSRRDFDRPELPEVILQIVNSYQVEPAQFHIEVTESSYSDDPERIAESLGRLSAAGFPVELDDFGTGYTSLSCLNDLPVDIIKIDKSLLKKDTGAGGRKSILALAVGIAKMLRIRTVQEGVETEEEFEKVRSLGCDFVQGFYFEKPVPRAGFEKYLPLPGGKD